MRALCLALFTALLLLGCRQNPTLVVPPSFERPGAVAFFCYDTTTRAVVPLSTCDGLEGVTTETLALTALVAQTARGEIASVDLRLDRVIDADVRVPGFTFVQVGEVPTGVVVPPNNPSVTYIASFGSRRIEYYPTSDFREDIDAEGSSGRGQVPLPDGPVDLVISEAEDALFVALPERGMVAAIPIEADLSLGTPELVAPTLVEPLPEPVAPAVVEYQKICPTSLEVRPPRVGADASLVVDPLAIAEPRRLFVDGDTLLVADESSAVIHRFQISGTTLTPLAPLMPGARIRELAITPIVPAAPGADVASEPARFLYAIDADEGSVLVMDYLEGSPSFGAVLPVHAGEGRWDRIRLAERARSLTVMTPGYPGLSECDPAMIPDDRLDDLTPGTLQGVFVAVGLANGLVEVVDVHDLDLACRGGRDCANPPQELDERVFIRRHAPRIGAFVTAASQVIGTPTFAFEGAPGRLEVDGTAGGGGPGLAPTPTCAPFLDPIFPSEAVEGSDDGLDPLICAVVEPWSARPERWDATWEGAIPGAVSGIAHAEIVEGRTEIAIEGHRLCARGVLGRDDVVGSMLTGEDPESLYGGDQVFITTDPLPDAMGNVDPDCQRFIADDDGLREEVGLPIVAAFQDRLVVEDPDGVLDCYRRMSGGATSALFGIEVRVDDAFAVVGAVSRFAHRVVANEEGACRVDREGQPWVADDPATHLNGRAFNDVPYSNPYVGFTITNAAGLRSETAILTFAVGSVPPALVVDVGLRGGGRLSTIVDAVRYSASDQRLYVIDSNSDSLVQFELDPFQREQTFE